MTYLAGNQLVVTNDGIQYLDALFRKKEAFFVASRKKYSIDYAVASGLFHQVACRLRTKEGYNLVCSSDTSVLVNDSWTHVKDLKPNEPIALQQQYNYNGIAHVPEQAFCFAKNYSPNFIPNYIFQGNTDTVHHYINRYYDEHGSLEDGSPVLPAIGDFADRLQIMLANIGIFSRKREKSLVLDCSNKTAEVLKVFDARGTHEPIATVESVEQLPVQDLIKVQVTYSTENCLTVNGILLGRCS